MEGTCEHLPAYPVGISAPLIQRRRNVVVESCDNLIAKKNNELKQEVRRLMKDLYRLKGKGMESNVQPSQDNREDMVKKFEKDPP